MKTKNNEELIMTEEDLLSSLIIILNAFEDKITTGNKKLVLDHIAKLKARSNVVSSHSFEGVAKFLKEDEVVALWTDGVMASSDMLPHCAYRLEAGKKYRITLEELKPEEPKQKTKKTK